MKLVNHEPWRSSLWNCKAHCWDHQHLWFSKLFTNEMKTDKRYTNLMEWLVKVQETLENHCGVGSFPQWNSETCGWGSGEEHNQWRVHFLQQTGDMGSTLLLLLRYQSLVRCYTSDAEQLLLHKHCSSSVYKQKPNKLYEIRGRVEKILNTYYRIRWRKTKYTYRGVVVIHWVRREPMKFKQRIISLFREMR